MVTRNHRRDVAATLVEGAAEPVGDDGVGGPGGVGERARPGGRPVELFFTQPSHLDAPILVDRRPLQIGGKAYSLPLAARRALRRRSVPTGMPFFLEGTGAYSELVNDFLRSLPANGCASANTWRAYAYDLNTFCRFLRSLPDRPSLLSVERRHIDVYAATRRRDLSSRPAAAGRVDNATWNRAIITLDSFYGWARHRDPNTHPPFVYKEASVRSPFGHVVATRRNTALARRAPTDTVKCISLEEFKLFRDHGLAGLPEDGTDSRGFLGRNPLRNVAFADLAVATGMRLEENASLLLAELPGGARPRPEGAQSYATRLGRLTTKGDKGRRIWISRRVLDGSLRAYLEEERDDAVFRARTAGRYASLDGVVGVSEWRLDRCMAVENGRRVAIRYDAVRHGQRSSLYTCGGDGLPCDPGMLWLTGSGMPMGIGSFDAVFARARDHLRREHGRDLVVTPHTLRHTFAVYMLAHLIRTMFDHLAGLRAEKRKVSSNAYAALMHDPLRRLQLLLGHASAESTRIYLTYLEEADELVEHAIASWGERLEGSGTFDEQEDRHG